MVVVLTLLASAAAARHWTSRSGGFAVDGELVDVKDGNAILKKDDGTQVSVPLNKLSLGDVRYINNELKSAEAGITGGKAESPAADKTQDEAAMQPVAAAAAALGWIRLHSPHKFYV